jgi:probable rRNA maturation factor
LKKIGFQELENGQINIKYTSEEEIKMLNEKFYNKEGVTNVLAFINNQETPESKEQLIGEIAICISQIEKEAKLYKKAVETRLKHMIVHGVLHLFGFDHQKKSEQKEMEQVEDDIITSCLGERPY